MIIIFFLEIQKRKHQIEVQKQVEKNNLQLQVIKSKYVPHFTFNAITSINYLLRKKEIRKASSYLVKMTELQRIALTNFEKPEIPLETELRFLDSYLSLERLRFEELLEYKIILDKKVSMDTLISNLCIHTMVENAIKHGLYNKAEQKWRLRIYILKVKNKLILSVEDNGIGLEKAIENQFNSTGTGLIMLKKQIQILNSDERKYYFSLNTLYTPDGRIRGARSSIIIETLGQNQV
jgi:sensor histidine kinase YesM